MHDLAGALADACAAYGARVTRDAVLEGRSGDVAVVPLLVEADGRALLMWPDLEGAQDPGHLSGLARDLAADGVVLVGRRADAELVTGWDLEDTARFLGWATLRSQGLSAPDPWPAGPAPAALEETLPPPFAQPFPGEASADTAPAVPGAQPIPEDDASFDLDGLLAAAQAEPSGPEPSVPPAPPSASAVPVDDMLAAALSGTPAARGPEQAPAVEPGPGRDLLWDLDAQEPQATARRLPVLVTPRQAKEVAQERLFHVDGYELVLQPVHLFDAEVDEFEGGSLDARTIHCRLQLNATDRTVATVDPDDVDPRLPDLLPADLDVRTEERALRVQPDRAVELVRQHLRRVHTRVVEVPAGGDDELFSYTERRRVEPRDDQVRVHPLGLYHRPVWRLLGPNGAIEVDAMTGHAVDADVRSFPDAVMLE